MMRMVSVAAAAAFLLVSAGACDSASRNETNAAAPVASGPGCAGHLRFRIERPSFAANGAGARFAPARLDDLNRRASRAFTAAANEICARGELDPAALRNVREVRVETGSGATETAVYDDPETGPETLFFQYAFAETDLALPGKADIQAGLLCWKDPGRPECEGRGD